MLEIERAKNQKEMSLLANERRPFLFKTGKQSSLEEFADAYGDCEVNFSSDEFALPRSTGAVSVTEYIKSRNEEFEGEVSSRSKRPYVFHDVQNDQESRLGTYVSQSELPDFFLKFEELFPMRAQRLSLAPDASYVNIHIHGAAINELLFGQKRWRVIHPYVTNVISLVLQEINVSDKYSFFEEEILPLAQDSTEDIASVLREAYREWHKQGLCRRAPMLEPLWHTPLIGKYVEGVTFTQEAGEAVFIPDAWGHSVLNVGWSLSRVFELEQISIPVMNRSYARHQDQNGGVIKVHEDLSVAVEKAAKFYIPGKAPIEASKLLIELVKLVDGKRSAKEIAALTDSPSQALKLLEMHSDSLFERVTSF